MKVTVEWRLVKNYLPKIKILCLMMQQFPFYKFWRTVLLHYCLQLHRVQLLKNHKTRNYNAHKAIVHCRKRNGTKVRIHITICLSHASINNTPQRKRSKG